jgi:hypothetical protein
MTLSGLPEWRLADVATELQVDYEVFCMDYDGPYLPDAHVGFIGDAADVGRSHSLLTNGAA